MRQICFSADVTEFLSLPEDSTLTVFLFQSQRNVFVPFSLSGALYLQQYLQLGTSEAPALHNTSCCPLQVPQKGKFSFSAMRAGTLGSTSFWLKGHVLAWFSHIKVPLDHSGNVNVLEAGIDEGLGVQNSDCRFSAAVYQLGSGTVHPFRNSEQMPIKASQNRYLAYIYVDACTCADLSGWHCAQSSQVLFISTVPGMVFGTWTP